MNYDTELQKWTPEQFANIWPTKRDKISLIKFEAAWIHFLNAVFVAIAVVAAALWQAYL